MIYLVLGIVLALVVAVVFSRKSKPGEEEKKVEVPDDCCGAHEVCEADSLLSADGKAEYFEDEELDNYKSKAADSYTDEQIEEFRDVLFTLKEREVAGWLKSLQARNINPPEIIREEALMIVAERRFVN
ncbi:hypothetical protein [Carboxylicivirga caseinilyticus]|uniref:hypothetical protein n=1 Tax=Carboxylicivirga caseinilyticus TaxID=3417572 RepID=UPI003D32561B|nr:hypothetical protein [Marinilabiliaceae bacterium A049]